MNVLMQERYTVCVLFAILLAAYAIDRGPLRLLDRVAQTKLSALPPKYDKYATVVTLLARDLGAKTIGDLVA